MSSEVKELEKMLFDLDKKPWLESFFNLPKTVADVVRIALVLLCAWHAFPHLLGVQKTTNFSMVSSELKNLSALCVILFMHVCVGDALVKKRMLLLAKVAKNLIQVQEKQSV